MLLPSQLQTKRATLLNLFIKPKLFNKAQTKRVLIFVPLHRCNIGSYLSPILGQYGIRNVDFLATFSLVFSQIFGSALGGLIQVENADKPDEAISSSLDLTIPVYMTVLKGGKYELAIVEPQGGSLVRDSVRPALKNRVKQQKKVATKRRYRRFISKLLRSRKRLMYRPRAASIRLPRRHLELLRLSLVVSRRLGIMEPWPIFADAFASVTKMSRNALYTSA